MRAGIRQEHPEYSEPEIRRELFLRLYRDCFTAAEAERIAQYVMAWRDE